MYLLSCNSFTQNAMFIFFSHITWTKIYVFAMQASSGGDNAELIGTGPSVQEEVLDGDSSGSDLEAINCEGDSSLKSEGNSSDEADEDR